MPIELIIRWAFALLLLAVFLACVWTNYDNLFGFSRKMRQRRIPPGSRVSPAMFVGGISGAIALTLWPEPKLAGWWWLPFLIDLPGTLGIGRGSDAAIEEAPRPPPPAAPPTPSIDLEKPLVGCFLGTAVGDALGLPYEGLGPRRLAKIFPDLARYHLLPFGRGMCSDDTEHTLMLAQAVYEAPQCTDDEMQAREVAAAFGWRLRFWLLGLPAGIGLATLRAILKLWLFIPPRWSGVHSAGNAPAMRSALLGLVYGDEPARLRALVRATTRITHTDPKVEQAAWTVARAAKLSASHEGGVDAKLLLANCNEEFGSGAGEWLALLQRVATSVENRESTRQFAVSLGLEKGVTGYSFHSVPVALHAWLSHPGDYRGAVLAAIECGGDTDTVAAITGAIAGAGCGKDGIPAPWLDRLAEWPRSVVWMERLGTVLAKRAVEGLSFTEPAPAAGAAKLLLRNAFFLVVVLAHGFRRLLPPY